MERKESCTREVAKLLALVRARRRYYHDILNLLPTAATMLASDGSISFANTAFCREFALREEDVRHRTVAQVLPSDALNRRILAARRSGLPLRPFFFKIRGKALRISVTPIHGWTHTGEIDTLLLIEDPREPYQDGVMSYRRDALLNLPEQILDDHIPAILWHADRQDFAFRSVRGAAQELLGFSIDHWKNTPDFFSERIHPDHRAATLSLYRAAIDRAGDASSEFRAFTSTGVVWLRETIRVDGPVIAGVITPLDHRKRIEEQAIRDERIRALRRLASRSSQTLDPAAATLSEQGMSMLIAGSNADDLEQTESRVSRISEITQELTGFTSRQPSPPGVVNVPRLLKQLSGRIAAVAGNRVSVDVNADHSVLAFAEEGQLEEVLSAVTASICRDALEGSRLTITCDLYTVAERIPHATLTPGDYACLVVHHHGRGLEFELQEPLFESLTSHGKRATLPALCRAYAAVREWGGDMAFISEQNTAAFLVYLPNCPSVELEQDPIPIDPDTSEGGGAPYQDLIELFLADVALPDPALPDPNDLEMPDSYPAEPVEIDSKFFERPLR